MSVLYKQKALGLEDLGERTIRFCASNEEEDRDGDVLIASGCDFTNFAKNPQFLKMHSTWEFPLGTPKNWVVDHLGKKVFIDVYFPTLEELTGGKPENASNEAKLIDFTYHCYKNKVLNAVSVGFIVKDAERNPTSSTPWGQIIKSWELIELSAVPIPANQSALVEAMKSFDPSGRVFSKGSIFPALDLDDSPAGAVHSKSGRRLSAATIETLKGVKACRDRIKGCHEEMKGYMEELDEMITKLMGAEEPEEPDDDVLEIDD